MHQIGLLRCWALDMGKSNASGADFHTYNLILAFGTGQNAGYLFYKLFQIEALES